MTSQITPIVTWVPWKPVSVKKLAPNMLRVEREPLVHEVGELVHLHADEEHPAHDRRAEPPQEHLPVALLRAVERQHDEERAEEQQRGARP